MYRSPVYADVCSLLVNVLLACAVMACSSGIAESPPPAANNSVVDQTAARAAPHRDSSEDRPGELLPGEPNSEPSGSTLDRRYEPILLTIAAEYTKWTRVDERPFVAPVACADASSVTQSAPSQVRVSQADSDDSPHGRKLYFLFARYKEQYLQLGAPRARSGSVANARDKKTDTEIPIGQAIVKQSWIARTVQPKANEPRTNPVAREPLRLTFGTPDPVRWVEDADGTRLTTRARAPLFVMTKVAPAPDTDEGWIYGTLTADGTTVTSAGRVATCMACHEGASHERLFGLAR